MGLFRLFLAVAVLFSHTGNLGGIKLIDAGAAVYCFFILSGFYIAMGLNERYVGPGANRAFYAGRFLRLWPTYAASILILVPTGIVASVFEQALKLPTVMGALTLFSNTFIIGLDLLAHVSNVDGRMVFSEFGVDKQHNGASLILNVPAWTLAFECLFYAAAPYVVRNFKRSLAFMLVGLVYWLSLRFFAPADISLRYRVDMYYPYAMLFFGLGILSYWMHRVGDIRNPRHWTLFLVIAGSLWVASPQPYTLLYVATAALAGILFEATKNSRLDKFFGDLSFPVYIFQIPVGTLVRWSGMVEPTPLLYVAATFVAATAAIYLIELPIEIMRKRLTQRMIGCSEKPTTASLPKGGPTLPA